MTNWIFYCCCLVTKSCLTLLWLPWMVAHQAPLFMGFPRQEHWSGLPFPSLGDLVDPRIKPTSPALASRFFTTVPPGKTKAQCLAQRKYIALVSVSPSSLVLFFSPVQCFYLQTIIHTISSYLFQFSSLSHVWLFVTPWTTARQASLSITNSQSLPKLMSVLASSSIYEDTYRSEPRLVSSFFHYIIL